MMKVAADFAAAAPHEGAPDDPQRLPGHRTQLAPPRRGPAELAPLAFALLGLYAQARRAAAAGTAALSAVFAAIAAVWLTPYAAGAWLCLNLSALALTQAVARRRPPERDDAAARRWRRDLVAAEAVQGTAWAILIVLIGQSADLAALACAAVMAILVCATTATLAPCIPAAAFAATAPILLAVLTFLRQIGSPDGSLPLIVLCCGALLYFLLLARKQHAAALETLSFREEKDELIAALEESKAGSDLARRRAEEANLAKSRFLATMSHELRTPLNAILGFSEVMKGELFGAHVVASYKEYSNDIHSSGSHLLTLINEILDLSRIEAGRFELKEEAVSLVQVVEDSRHLLKLRANKRSLTIDEAVEPNLPRLWADERALRQVTLNLLSNAIKFTPPGGSIKIRIGWTASGGQYLAVCDSGPGIPDDEIPVVMSAFGRGARAQQNADEGSGLGLPIVKGLVELHGGAFTLKSKPNEGAEAIVIFPAGRVLPQRPNAAAAQRLKRRGRAETQTAA